MKSNEKNTATVDPDDNGLVLTFRGKSFLDSRDAPEFDEAFEEALGIQKAVAYVKEAGLSSDQLADFGAPRGKFIRWRSREE